MFFFTVSIKCNWIFLLDMKEYWYKTKYVNFNFKILYPFL